MYSANKLLRKWNIWPKNQSSQYILARNSVYCDASNVGISAVVKRSWTHDHELRLDLLQKAHRQFRYLGINKLGLLSPHYWPEIISDVSSYVRHWHMPKVQETLNQDIRIAGIATTHRATLRPSSNGHYRRLFWIRLSKLRYSLLTMLLGGAHLGSVWWTS